MLKSLTLLALLAICCTIVGCENRVPRTPEITVPAKMNPIDLGNGMLEFEFPEHWPESLWSYMHEHPELRIVAFGNGTSQVGMHSHWTKHMLVIVEPRQDRQDVGADTRGPDMDMR